MAEKQRKQLTDEDLQLLRNMFDRFDVNGDGTISREELKEMMEQVHLTVVTEEDVQEAMNEADANGDGSISFFEFVGIMLKWSGAEETDEDIREAFQIFDVDKSGTIDKNEVMQLSHVLGNPLTADEVDRMFAKYDIDGDGELTFEEFKTMYTSEDN